MASFRGFGIGSFMRISSFGFQIELGREFGAKIQVGRPRAGGPLSFGQLPSQFVAAGLERLAAASLQFENIVPERFAPGEVVAAVAARRFTRPVARVWILVAVRIEKGLDRPHRVEQLLFGRQDSQEPSSLARFDRFPLPPPDDQQLLQHRSLSAHQLSQFAGIERVGCVRLRHETVCRKICWIVIGLPGRPGGNDVSA